MSTEAQLQEAYGDLADFLGRLWDIGAEGGLLKAVVGTDGTEYVAGDKAFASVRGRETYEYLCEAADNLRWALNALDSASYHAGLHSQQEEHTQ